MGLTDSTKRLLRREGFGRRTVDALSDELGRTLSDEIVEAAGWVATSSIVVVADGATILDLAERHQAGLPAADSIVLTLPDSVPGPNNDQYRHLTAWDGDVLVWPQPVYIDAGGRLRLGPVPANGATQMYLAGSLVWALE